MSSPFDIFSQVDSSAFFASTSTDFTEATSPPPDMELPSEDLSVRPMNLKVLYSFDEGNKTNCLARYPQTLDIRTAALDETTRIGIIELKTCIQAIINASPELVAKLGQDYTIYAYDYSEYETPLVGQGMLSWALASASTTPNAPAHQSNTIVTGRVCKNVMGLFTKGPQETLEVKLRLVPVPTTLQREYLASIQKYREMSNAVGQDFDPQVWTNFVQANPTFFAGSSRPPLQRSFSASAEMSGMGAVQQLLRGNASPRDSTAPATIAQANQQMQLGTSRASTPVMNQAAVPPQRGADAPGSRPNSRASVRGATQQQGQPTTKRKGSVSAGYVSNDEAPEEGPAKKRARVMKADWPVSGTIEQQPESLRVAAGNASSIRNMYRPIAINPAMHLANVNTTSEEPVRPPTPISKPATQKNRRARPAFSNLRRESLGQEAAAYVSPYGAPPTDQTVIDSGLAVSPEQGGFARSYSNTPANIPSSPPVYEGMTSMPGTPQLPPVRRDHQDSGFLSGAGATDLVFDDYNFHPLEGDAWSPELPNEVVTDVATFPESRPTSISPSKMGQFKEMMPGPQETLPQKAPPRTFNHITRRPMNCDAPPVLLSDMLQPQPDLTQGQSQQASQPDPREVPQLAQPQITVTTSSRPNSRPSSRAGSRPAMAPPTAPVAAALAHVASHPLVRAQSVGSITLPPVAASDPVHPQTSRLQRSQTWAEESQHPASDAPTSSKDAKPRTGSGAKRSRQVQARLHDSIEKGEMPPYCENCGAIETPTWRKAYGKIFEEGYENVHISDEEGGVMCSEILEQDVTGRVTRFRVLKKTISKGELGEGEFSVVLFCNPCGLYFYKHKVMRPEDKWIKKPKDPNEKKKRPPRKRSRKKKNNDQSASDGQTRQDSTAVTDASSPADGAIDGDEEFDDEEPDEPPAKRPRAQSAEPNRSSDPSNQRWENHVAAAAALQQAIQLSPARQLGSEGAPIQLDESPSTRRLLFPSPRQEGQLKTLDDASLTTSLTQLRRSPRHGAALLPVDNESPTAPRRSPRRGVGSLRTSDEGSPTALRRSPRFNKQYMIPELHVTDPKNKENQPPISEMEDDGLGHLFDDDEVVERPTTPTPSSRSSRNRFETPSPATKAAQFTITPGQKSAHVKAVMKLIDEPVAASPLESRNIADVIDAKKHTLSPHSAALAEFLRDACSSNAYANTPSKPSPKPMSNQQTPDSQPPDPASFDISQLDDLGPDYGSHLFDDPFEGDVHGFDVLDPPAEQEAQRINDLLGKV